MSKNIIYKPEVTCQFLFSNSSQSRLLLQCLACQTFRDKYLNLLHVRIQQNVVQLPQSISYVKGKKLESFSRRINNTHRQRTTGSIEHQTSITGTSQRELNNNCVVKWYNNYSVYFLRKLITYLQSMDFCANKMCHVRVEHADDQGTSGDA